MKLCMVTLTFKSADEILCCDHSNESSLPVLTHDAICFSKFGNLVEICFLLNLAVKGLKGLFTNQKVRVPYPFIYLKPEKGTPFGWSLRVLTLIGIIPGAVYEVKFVSANTREPLDNV